MALIAFAVAVVHAARSRSREASSVSWLRVGATAGLAVFVIHSAFDFLWHIPVLPVMAAVLIGLLIADDPTRVAGRIERGPRDG